MKSILLLTANPKKTHSLRLQEEEREIKERLRLAGYGKTPINSTGATRPRDIQQSILDFKPQIVHFSGHGSGQDGLVFEDLNGYAKFISSEALANLFKLFSNRVECVVLNACYSKAQAETIAQCINYVVGMSQSIGDRAAIEFAVGFYTALGAGESIEFAYQLGCNAIHLEGIAEYMTPVLYVQGEVLDFSQRSSYSTTLEDLGKDITINPEIIRAGVSKLYNDYPKDSYRTWQAMKSKTESLEELAAVAEFELLTKKSEQAFREMEMWSHKAKDLFNEIIGLCKSRYSTSFLLDAHRNLALINVYEGAFGIANKHFDDAEEISRKHNYWLDISRVLFTKAIGQRFQGEYILSRRTFETTLSLLRQPDFNAETGFLDLLCKMDLALMELINSPALGRKEINLVTQQIEETQHSQAIMSARYKKAIYSLAFGEITKAKEIATSAKECTDITFQPNWIGNFSLFDGICSLVEDDSNAEDLLYDAYQNYRSINFIQPIWITASILIFFYVCSNRMTEAFEIRERYKSDKAAKFKDADPIFKEPIEINNLELPMTFAKLLVQI